MEPASPEVPVSERLPPLQVLSSAAKETAITEMQALLDRRTGRTHTREQARLAFETLAGFYALVTEWKATADAEDPDWAARAPVPVPAHRTFNKARKAKTQE